MLLAFLTA